MSQKESAYKEWSIEKGDYVRKDLSKQDMIYNTKMKPLTKTLIYGLVLLAVVLGVMLQMKLSHF